MLHAPAAQARFAGRCAWLILQVVLVAAGAGCAALWFAGRLGSSAVAAALSAATSAAAAAAWAMRSIPAPAGQLRWDGASWSVEIDGREPLPGTPTPTIDLGPWMLVRFTPSACADRIAPSTLWFALARAAAPHDWGLLRTALFAGGRRGDGGSDGGAAMV